jgi:hypothetical protein
MTMRTFYGPVLMRDAGIVARRHHAVMLHERVIAARQIMLGIAVQVAEGRRQAVAAMLVGNATQDPQGILQSLGKGHEAFTAENDMGMLETGEDQAEVIKHMLEGLTGDGHAGRPHVGEVGQAQAAWFVRLSEDHLPVGTVQRPPGSYAPLQSAPDAGVDLRVTAADLIENRNRPQLGRGLQHWHDLSFPDRCQRIRTAAAARFLLL